MEVSHLHAVLGQFIVSLACWGRLQSSGDDGETHQLKGKMIALISWETSAVYCIEQKHIKPWCETKCESKELLWEHTLCAVKCSSKFSDQLSKNTKVNRRKVTVDELLWPHNIEKPNIMCVMSVEWTEADNWCFELMLHSLPVTDTRLQWLPSYHWTSALGSGSWLNLFACRFHSYPVCHHWGQFYICVLMCAWSVDSKSTFFC